jgi:hypothetical protein
MRPRRQRQEQELKQFVDNCAKKHDRSGPVRLRRSLQGDQLFREYLDQIFGAMTQILVR